MESKELSKQTKLRQVHRHGELTDGWGEGAEGRGENGEGIWKHKLAVTELSWG